MKKKTIMRCASAVIALILFLCPLSICFATDPTPAPTSPAIQQVNDLAKEVIYYYIWIYLRSVGINVEYGDIEEYTGAINDWIETELLEWLDTVPGIGTIDQLLYPWKFFWNPDGYLVGNQSFLDDIRDFTEYLIDIFDLDDNETVQTSTSGYSIDELIVYALPYVYSNSAGTQGVTVSVISSATDVYYAVNRASSSATTAKVVPISLGTGSVNVHEYYTSGGYTDTSYTLVNRSGTPWYYSDQLPGMSAGRFTNNGYVTYTITEIRSALDANNSVTSYGNGVYIITNTINAPSATDADGTNSIVITPSGNIYTPQDWDGTIYVDNLPAIVSTGSIPNPGFGDVFLPLRAFVNTFSEGMAIVKDVVFHLPTEALAIFYAIMSITVIFGALHMFKEH